MKLASLFLGLIAISSISAQNPPLVITSSASLGGAVNWGYDVSLSANGGAPPYAWTAQNLPPGLQISPAGTITGTVTIVGTWQANITVTDSQLATASQTITFSFVPGAPALSLTPISPPPDVTGRRPPPYVIQIASVSSSPPGAAVTLTLPNPLDCDPGTGTVHCIGFPGGNSATAACTNNVDFAQSITIQTPTEQPVYLCNRFPNGIPGDENSPDGNTAIVTAYISMTATAPGYPILEAELPVEAVGVGHLSFASPIYVPATGAGIVVVTVLNPFPMEALIDPGPTDHDPWIGVTPAPNCQPTTCAFTISADPSLLIGAVAGQVYAGKVTFKTQNSNSDLKVHYQYSGTPSTVTSLAFSGTVGQGFAAMATAAGGIGSLTWSSTDMPPGLQISAAGGISGIVGTAGFFISHLTVQDQANHIVTAAVTFTVAPILQQIIPGDFDGDGKADYAVWRPADGTWWVTPSSNPPAIRIQQWGLPGDIPIAGDFDGDGKADYAVWRPANGTWWVMSSSNPSAIRIQQWGLAGDIPVAGDFDGDGKTDYAVWRPADGTWWVMPSSNPSAIRIQQWGLPGDIPVAGDFDGDGKTDYAVWRPANGTWWVMPSSNPSAIRVQQWGLPGDIPLVGDVDGDGKIDYSVWRPSDGTWWVIPSSNPSAIRIQQWGLPGDIPVPGDFDGDAKTDFAVWRPSIGVWLVIPSLNPPSPIQTQWGLPHDVPL